MSTPHRYAVYGGGLESTLELPELPADGTRALRWRFSTEPSLAPMRDAVELGVEHIYGNVHARLHRHAHGHRIEIDDTGAFDIAADDGHIRCTPRAEAWPEFVRAHLIGRVLATAMFNDGWLPLHGSAVATRDGVIAFLAPKGFGKSSLALALTQAGARMVTDDTLPVEPRAGGPSIAWPGVHGVRLRIDAADALGASSEEAATREGKRVAPIAHDQRQLAPLPLAALYLLDPQAPDTMGAAALRTAFPMPLAAMAVVAHVKIGGMLGAGAAAPMLARAAVIAAGASVHRLHLSRDLALLPTAATTILRWHGGPP